MLKKTPGVEYDINRRWENGVPHHPQSISILKRVNELDWELLDGALDLKTGGDGDSGETLMYLLDIFFEERDVATSKSCTRS